MKRAPVWPAYLVAAACLVIALISSIADTALLGQLKSVQTESARLSARATALARSLADDRTTLSDLLDSDARHYPITGGDVVTRSNRIYIAMRELPEPPRGKVYQAWTRPKTSARMQPSLTFVPNVRGIAVVALPADARATAEVEISAEPEGGSKQPTGTPLADVSLTAQ